MEKEITGTQENFNAEVLRAQCPVMVDFYATWCAPCQALAPTVAKLAESSDWRVVKVDVDKESDLAQRMQILSIPTLVFFQNGKEISRRVGLQSEESLRALLQSML